MGPSSGAEGSWCDAGPDVRGIVMSFAMFSVGLPGDAPAAVPDRLLHAIGAVWESLDEPSPGFELAWPQADGTLNVIVRAGQREVGDDVAKRIGDVLGTQARTIPDMRGDDPVGTVGLQYMLGGSVPELLNAVPPDTVTCSICHVDLTISGHTPDCPYSRD